MGWWFDWQLKREQRKILRRLPPSLREKARAEFEQGWRESENRRRQQRLFPPN